VKYLLTALAIVLAFAAGAKFATVRNDLTARRATIAGQRAQLNAAFEARAELISELAAEAPPQLASVQSEVASAQNALAKAQTPEAKAEANDRLSAALANLESHLDIADISDDLAGAADRIAEERERYNGELEHYNAVIQTFPVNLVAAISGYARADAYFKTGPYGNGGTGSK
jgi:LemA protein